MTPPSSFRSLQQMGVVVGYLHVSIALFEVVSPIILTALVNEDNNLGRQCVRRTAVARMFVRCTGDVSFNKRSADAGTLWPRQRTRADEIDKWLRCFLFQSNGAGEETLAGLHLYLLDTFDCVQDGLMCGCCSFT